MTAKIFINANGIINGALPNLHTNHATIFDETWRELSAYTKLSAADDEKKTTEKMEHI